MTDAGIELSVLLMRVSICSIYVGSVLYSFGRLNHELNVQQKIIDRDVWHKNCLLAAFWSLLLSLALAIYLIINENVNRIVREQLSFRCYIKKKDPIYEQIIDMELPNEWQGENGLESQMKNLWENV